LAKKLVEATDLGLSEDDMTVFVIGKREYALSPLKFAAVEQVWPLMDDFGGLDRASPEAAIKSVNIILQIVTIGSAQDARIARRIASENGQEIDLIDVTVDDLKDELAPNQMDGINEQLIALLAKSGMQPDVGEKAAGEGENLIESPSMGTSPASMPN
jgi:hypothetical protein